MAPVRRPGSAWPPTAAVRFCARLARVRVCWARWRGRPGRRAPQGSGRVSCAPRPAPLWSGHAKSSGGPTRHQRHARHRRARLGAVKACPWSQSGRCRHSCAIRSISSNDACASGSKSQCSLKHWGLLLPACVAARNTRQARRVSFNHRRQFTRRHDGVHGTLPAKNLSQSGGVENRHHR